MNSVATYDSVWFFTILKFGLVIQAIETIPEVHRLLVRCILQQKELPTRRKATAHLFQEHDRGSRARRLRLVRNTKRLSGRANFQIRNLERRS